MPTLKKFGLYPKEYSELFKRVVKEGEMIIPCSTPETAANLRDRLYAFRTALLKAAIANPALREAADYARRFQFSLAKSRVCVRLKPSGDPAVLNALK